MRRIGLIAGIVVLAAALMYLNAGIGKNAQSDSDDDSQSSSQAQTPPKTPPPTAPAPPSATLPPEQTVGNPATARYKINVGWSYDRVNQAHPTALNQTLDTLRQYAATHKDVAMQIVNVDVPPGARSPASRGIIGTGILVNGKPVVGLTGNPGEGPATPQAIAEKLKMAAP